MKSVPEVMQQQPDERAFWSSILSVLAGICVVCALLPASGYCQGEVALDAGEKKQLNTFFSNFAETGMKSFAKNSVTDADMLQFATWHCVMNAPKSFKRTKSGYQIIIPASEIDKITRKYFGKALSAHKQERYLADLATGEASIFAQVDKMFSRPDGTFQAQGTIYYTGSGSTPDPHGTRAAWKKAGEDVRVYGTYSAVIQPTQPTQPGQPGQPDKKRFILLEYTVVEKQ